MRRWTENSPEGFLGWDFVLVSPEKGELLLERTHTLANAVLDRVDWYDGAATVRTRAPAGTLTLEW